MFQTSNLINRFLTILKNFIFFFFFRISFYLRIIVDLKCLYYSQITSFLTRDKLGMRLSNYMTEISIKNWIPFQQLLRLGKLRKSKIMREENSSKIRCVCIVNNYISCKTIGYFGALPIIPISVGGIYILNLHLKISIFFTLLKIKYKYRYLLVFNNLQIK